MSKCFTCGSTFNGSTKELLTKFKRDKKDYYFYTLEEKGDVYLVSKKQFKHVFSTKIKPNFKNGANYAHISEFKG